jgi:hypothetical protein
MVGADLTSFNFARIFGPPHPQLSTFSQNEESDESPKTCNFTGVFAPETDAACHKPLKKMDPLALWGDLGDRRAGPGGTFPQTKPDLPSER